MNKSRIDFSRNDNIILATKNEDYNMKVTPWPSFLTVIWQPAIPVVDKNWAC